MKAKRLLSLLLAVAMMMSVFFTVTAQETTTSATTDPNGVYVTVAGAGSKDGSSWANAMAITETTDLQAAWDKVAEDGTLYIGSGNYGVKQIKITADNDGKDINNFKKIVGVDTGAGKPKFVGNFDRKAKGNDNLIKIEKGANFIWVENLSIDNYCYGIRTYGNNEGLRAYNIDFTNAEDNFYLSGGLTSENATNRLKDVIIENCTSQNFKKSMVRLRDGVCDALISKCVADAGGKDFWESDNFPMAFQISSTNYAGTFNERITFVDVEARNCYHEAKGGDGDVLLGYWNADGYTTEGNVRDYVYIRCRAYGTTDGGWDTKGYNPTLIDCVAMDNKRNYRFWSKGQATLVNCIAAYAETKGGIGADCGIMATGGSKTDAAGTDPTDNGFVEAYNCTIWNNKGTQLLTEGGTIKLYNCIVGMDDDAVIAHNKSDKSEAGWTGALHYLHPEYSNHQVFYNNSIIYIKGESDESLNPKFENATKEWFRGDNTNWNSTTFGKDFGYYFDPNYSNAITPTKLEDHLAVVDMTESYAWAKDAVDFVMKNDYLSGRTSFNGYNGTTNVAQQSKLFGPKYNMTRGEFASMLVRTLGITATAGDNFSDITDDYKYKEDIAIAKAAGVVNGNDNGGVITFDPHNSITRQEVMVMLSRALKKCGKLEEGYNAALTALDQFGDKGSIAEWAKQDVANMVEKQIIIGSDGNVNPLGNTTRAEGAVIGERVYNLK